MSPSRSGSPGVAPGAALGVAWLVGFVHVVTGTGPLVTEVLLAVVAFGCARWGSTLVVWLSALSIPLGAAIAVVWLDPNVFYDSLRVAGVQGLARRAYDGSNSWRLSAGLLGSALLVAPGSRAWPCASPRGSRCPGPRRWLPRPSATRPRRSPGCARSRPAWPATSTTSSATRSR